jgi:hypothetical protein
MKPNTPHMVVTPENAICLGNHFIAASSIRETCFGLIHTFVMRGLITNAENRAVWENLHRLLYYWQDAYITSFDDDGMGI